jgi:biotin operon repressor
MQMDYRLNYIKEHYKKETKEEMAQALGMTHNQVEWIMKKHNIKLYNSKKYSENEIDFIKANYPTYGSKYCAKILDRSENAINKKIKKLGLSIQWGYHYIDKQGYMVNCSDRKNKYYVHRRVMEEKLGRKLKSNEIVHHIDGNKLNNNPDNLELTNRSEHINKHRKDLVKSTQDIV